MGWGDRAHQVIIPSLGKSNHYLARELYLKIMCLSNFPSAVAALSKRPYSAMIGGGSPRPGAAKRARRRPEPKNKKSVAFSASVGMRCFFHNAPQVDNDRDGDPSWLKKDEVDRMKARAKALSKLHTRARARRLAAGSAGGHTPTLPSSVGDVTRYKIGGESLRGMEHLTDAETGRRRRRVQDEAMRAVEDGQRGRKLALRVLEISSSSLGGSSYSSFSIHQAMKEAAKVDAARLARAYGSKAREALAYARAVAEEDARVASRILTEDLPSSPSPADGAEKRRPVKCSGKKSSRSSSGDPSVAAEIIKSLLLGTMSRHRNVASAQA